MQSLCAVAPLRWRIDDSSIADFFMFLPKMIAEFQALDWNWCDGDVTVKACFWTDTTVYHSKSDVIDIRFSYRLRCFFGFFLLCLPTFVLSSCLLVFFISVVPAVQRSLCGDVFGRSSSQIGHKFSQIVCPVQIFCSNLFFCVKFAIFAPPFGGFVHRFRRT